MTHLPLTPASALVNPWHAFLHDYHDTISAGLFTGIIDLKGRWEQLEQRGGNCNQGRMAWYAFSVSCTRVSDATCSPNPNYTDI